MIKTLRQYQRFSVIPVFLLNKNRLLMTSKSIINGKNNKLAMRITKDVIEEQSP